MVILKYKICIFYNINYQKKIKDKQIDENVHAKFVRFGLGDFQREEFFAKKGKNVELKAGFDYADVFTAFLAEHAKGDIEVKGVIVSSTKELEPTLKDLGFDSCASRGM